MGREVMGGVGGDRGSWEGEMEGIGRAGREMGRGRWEGEVVAQREKKEDGREKRESRKGKGEISSKKENGKGDSKKEKQEK